MLFGELLSAIQEAEKAWETITQDVGKDNETHQYLSKAYLVLHTRYVQMPVKNLSNLLAGLILNQPKVLKQTKVNNAFIELCKTMSSHVSQLGKLNPETQQWKKTVDNLEESKKKIADFDISLLDFDDSITIEVRFSPSIKTDIIQQIKKHPKVDSSKTWMSTASIRVILK